MSDTFNLMPTTKQFGRKCRLTVQIAPEIGIAADAINATSPAPAEGEAAATPSPVPDMLHKALDLSDMRIVFKVNQATSDNAQFAEIYVYNLSEQTMNTLEGDGVVVAGQKVILEAGYGDDMDIIFKGDVFQVRRGRESQTDTWFCILAQAGNQTLSTAVVRKEFPAGTTPKQMQDFIKAEYLNYGVDTGYMCKVSDDQGLPRSKSVFAPLKDFLKQFCRDNNAEAIIEDDTIKMLPLGENTGTPAYVLNTRTGLVGMPQLTTDGLNVTSLLNPRLKYGGQIKVDIDSIQTQSYDTSYGGGYIDQTQKSLDTAAGKYGRYNIISVTHSGDTRGNDWYTQMIAVGLGAQVQISGTSIKAVENGTDEEGGDSGAE